MFNLFTQISFFQIGSLFQSCFCIEMEYLCCEMEYLCCFDGCKLNHASPGREGWKIVTKLLRSCAYLTSSCHGKYSLNVMSRLQSQVKHPSF